MSIENRAKSARRATIAATLVGVLAIACLSACSTASAPQSPAPQTATSSPITPSGEHPAANSSEAPATVHVGEKSNAIVYEGGGASGFNANLTGALKVKIGSPRDGQLVLIWLLVGSDHATLMPPKGYKQVGSMWVFNVGNTAAALFYHFWHSGDPTILNFGVGTNSAHCEWVYSYYSGVNTSTPFDGTPTEATGKLTTTGSSPSITPGVGNNADTLLMLYGQATAVGGRVSSPSLGTMRKQYSYLHIAVWVDSPLSSSSATGAQTISSNVTGNWIGVQALLLPQ